MMMMYYIPPSQPYAPPQPTGRYWRDGTLPRRFSDDVNADAHPYLSQKKNEQALTRYNAVTFVRNNTYMDNQSFAQLLCDIRDVQAAFQQAYYAKKLAQYQQRSWWGKLLHRKPKEKAVPPRAEQTFQLLEERHADTEHKAALFCALGELHDRGLIHFSGQYPDKIRIDITRLGQDVLADLQKLSPPIYRRDNLETPPNYYSPPYRAKTTSHRHHFIV